MITTEISIGGVRVEKGARIHVPTNLDGGFRFRFEAVCEDDAGTTWHAVVTLGNEVVVETGQFADHYQAVREAESMLTTRLAALIRG
jgi:hypothetical protein